MANTLTLTGLTELIYAAKDIVAAEPCAFVNSVTVNSGTEGVSVNGTVSSFKTSQPSVDSSAFVPSMTLPSAQDLTVTTDTMTLDQTARVSISLNGETLRQLDHTAGRDNVINNLIAQGIRGLRNTIEAHVGLVAARGASRVTGTAATTPFASNQNSVNAARQILFDNGCAVNDGQISLVLNSNASTNLRNLTNLYRVNESGNDALLRKGTLLDISGIMLKESAGVASPTAGAMASATSTSAAFTVGQTVIPLATAGTGVVAAGDIVSFANDTNAYVVSSVSFAGANPASGDSITLAQPGLQKAQGVATRAITVTATAARNVMFHKSAMELAMRPISLPGGRDAGEHSTFTDEKSGLVFDAGLYLGDGLATLRFMTLYKAKVWKPEFVTSILG